MKKKKLEFHRLTIDLEPDLFKQLKAHAAENERSASKQAKVIIKEYLEDRGT